MFGIDMNLLAMAGLAVTNLLTVVLLLQVRKEIGTVAVHTNSIVEQLVKAAEKASHAQGMKDEQARQAAS